MSPATPPNDTTSRHGPDPGPAAVPRAEAWRFWFKLGFISFGGPAGQIALMHAELVERRRWISEARFLHALNYCMLLPGPEAQQLATYLGWLMHRSAGGIVAGVLFVLPSLVLMIALAALYMAHGQQPLVAAVFAAIKPAVVAIVAQAAWRIGRRTLVNGWRITLALAAFAALLGHLPFPWIVAGAALVGVVLARWRPQALAGGTAHRPAAPPAQARAPAATAPAVPPVPGEHPAPASPVHPARPLIDDDTPVPAHARFSRARLAAVIGAGLLLWALPMAALVAWAGLGGPYTQMAWFFTQAALLTFGGAYAVLPFVHQGAVLTHGWLSAAQMMDGLALGETTPGPLIMVVAFVAFVGGWQHPAVAALLGPGHELLGGTLAALLVTWFTFLPSFVFILAGGPLVEHTHGRIGYTAPLAAISAAVVGVVAHLAVFFAGHVLWPPDGTGAFDARAALIGAAAALALFVARRGVIEVIAGAAVLGLVLGLAGV